MSEYIRGLCVRKDISFMEILTHNLYAMSIFAPHTISKKMLYYSYIEMRAKCSNSMQKKYTFPIVDFYRKANGLRTLLN